MSVNYCRTQKRTLGFRNCNSGARLAVGISWAKSRWIRNCQCGWGSTSNTCRWPRKRENWPSSEAHMAVSKKYLSPGLSSRCRESVHRKSADTATKELVPRHEVRNYKTGYSVVSLRSWATVNLFVYLCCVQNHTKRMDQVQAVIVIRATWWF